MLWATALWLRRSSAAVAFPAMLLVVVAGIWSRGGWEYEWDWALSWAASTTVLLGPIVAGLVAHDRARRQAPTFTGMERSTVRGLQGALSVPTAAFLLGMAAWILAAGIASVWVAFHHPVGVPAMSIFAEVAVVLLAAAFFGGAVGTWVTSRAAGPLAAIAVYVLVLSASRLGLDGLMSAGGAIGTLVGLERSPRGLAGFVIVHVAFAAAAALLIAVRCTVSARGRIAGAVTAGVVLVAGLTGFAALKEVNTYVAVPVAQICVGTAPAVCGPDDFRRPLEIASVGLQAAARDLAGSGLALRDRYVLERGLVGQQFPSDAGVLTLNPETFGGGAYSLDEVEMTLATPTRCAAFAEEVAPDDLLSAQSIVMDWLSAQLSRGGATGPAPDDVQRAYDLVLNCEPGRTPMR